MSGACGWGMLGIPVCGILAGAYQSAGPGCDGRAPCMPGWYMSSSMGWRSIAGGWGTPCIAGGGMETIGMAGAPGAVRGGGCGGNMAGLRGPKGPTVPRWWPTGPAGLVGMVAAAGAALVSGLKRSARRLSSDDARGLSKEWARRRGSEAVSILSGDGNLVGSCCHPSGDAARDSTGYVWRLSCDRARRSLENPCHFSGDCQQRRSGV